MPNQAKKNFSSIVHWGLAVIGGLSAGVTIAVAPVKDFAIDHPLWGWGLFVSALIVLPFIVTSGAQSQAKASEKSAAAQIKAAEDAAAVQVKAAQEDALAQVQSFKNDAAARVKDIELLRERLDGWELNSWFFSYLTGAAMHEHLSLDFAHDIETHLSRWEFDAREMTDPEVERIWKACEKTARDYNSKIDEYMFMKASSQSHLQVPPEWLEKDPDRHAQAFNELRSALNCLLDAIRDAHRIMH